MDTNYKIREVEEVLDILEMIDAIKNFYKSVGYDEDLMIEIEVKPVGRKNS